MKLSHVLEEYFREKKIEYYATLSYADLHEINSEIMLRESFTPRSAILFLIPYYVSSAENLSMYATSLDYHLVIRELTEGLISRFSSLAPQYSFKGYGDHSPVDECHAALIAGLGIKGDNGLIINEKYGSYVFVADVISDAPPEELSAIFPGRISECKHCGRCKSACPTGILRGEGCDCLSFITQRKGELTDEEISLMKDVGTVWGCDECQVYCPYNREPIVTPVEFFHRERITLLTSDLLASMDKATFSKRAFAWRGRRTVERNLDKLGY